MWEGHCGLQEKGESSALLCCTGVSLFEEMEGMNLFEM